MLQKKIKQIQLQLILFLIPLTSMFIAELDVVRPKKRNQFRCKTSIFDKN